MNPSNEGDLLKKPHAYVKRIDGSSGYEPVVEIAEIAPTPIKIVPVPAAKPVAAK